MAITTVLFDLDGTLLPMDFDTFVAAYFQGIAKKAAPYGYEPKQLIASIWAGTAAMVKNDGTMTNRERFWAEFEKIYGSEALKDIPVFDEYYVKEFQQVKEVCGFQPLAAQLIRWLREQGVRVILATNPIFPSAATESRIRWAGLQPEDFVYYTTYDNSCRCKPNPGYYADILNHLQIDPRECMMIGNDVSEDMAAATLGMEVFLITDCLINKNNEDLGAYPHGSFADMTAYVKKQIAPSVY